MRFIGNAPVDGEVRAIASGALATGDTVVVNSDGTVSVVAGSSISQAVGTTATTGSYALYVASAYDANSQRFVLAYTDVDNSLYGTAAVGTVSGSSISFGTPVVFESARSEFISAAFDSSSNKVVITYRDDPSPNSYGTAVVGTVSGTSISFGSPVVFSTGGTQNTSVVYDSSAQKVFIAYRNTSNASYGTGIVGTVSGTSISFGSAVVFNSANTSSLSASYDANAQKIFIAYRDNGNSSYGTGIVGTISGDSISFGAATVFESARINFVATAYDASAQKVVAFYRDELDSNKGTAVVGTISGTSVSFGSVVVFAEPANIAISATYDANASKVVVCYQNGSSQGGVVSGKVSGTSITFDTPTTFDTGTPTYLSATYDANAEKSVISYDDGNNEGRASSVTFAAGYTSTNLTSENFVGFANSGYASGQSAALNSTCSVDKNQSGLTAGETYYVQTDGTLGTTPADPSVLAGTAISSNSIIVKG